MTERVGFSTVNLDEVTQQLQALVSAIVTTLEV